MTELLVFDFDGVVIDSEALMREAFAHSYAALNLEDEPPIELYLTHMGKPFAAIMSEMNLPQELWQPYSDYSARNGHLVQTFPGMPEALAQFRRWGLKLALLTGKEAPRTHALLRQFGLADLFDPVITAQDLTRPKPHAEGLIRILAAHDLEAERAMMVGDSVHDIACAQAAGVRGIGALWGTKPERLRTVCRPQDLAADVPELIALVQASLRP